MLFNSSHNSKAFEKLPVDYYGVLEVNEDEDEITLKRAYRQVVLVVHPDKNPHPDAKLAFDKIQEAYAVLSSRERRESYDKGMMNRRKKRWHRLKKVLIITIITTTISDISNSSM